MSETKFTPGPWTIGPNQPSGKTFGKLTTYEIGGEKSAVWCAQVIADEYGEANAALISASPTMYDYIAKKAEGGDAEAKALIDSIWSR